MSSRPGWVVICTLTCLCSVMPRSASAQIVAGAAIDRDVHRFPGNADDNRLEGSATGWLWLGGATLLSHLAVRVEDAHGGDIVNTQTFTVDIDGRVATITSSLTHNVRSTTGLGGFTHRPAPRIRLTYLAGLSSTTVRRTFETNAPPLVLVPPDVSHSLKETTTSDFWSLMLGADVMAQLVPHLALLAGVRWQQLKLDETGTSFRPLVGGVWVF